MRWAVGPDAPAARSKKMLPPGENDFLRHGVEFGQGDFAGARLADAGVTPAAFSRSLTATRIADRDEAEFG